MNATDFSDKTYEDERGDKKDQRKEELEELRRLISQQKDQILQLQERLDNPEIHVKDVERVLPEAIKLRTSRDEKVMVKALEPNIEAGIRVSIKKNPKNIADTLFPIMGPAIRKAITTTLHSMIQSFNQMLEHTFTVQGMKWRWEAKKTKKPVAEVVLLHTLKYQVEQIFLIHRKTGLVLQHVVAKEATSQDPDMVSSMLTAILGFVQDSFGEEQDESIDTLRMGGGRSVWIEQGPHAMLAAVIRGTPPLDLRSRFREVIDEIHVDHNEDLESFEGDTEPFDALGYQLDACLEFKVKEVKAKRIPIWLKLVIIVALAFFLRSYFSVRDNLRWTNFLDRLNSEPGIVVSSTEEHSGKYHVFGLRDPLAADPVAILNKAKLEPGSVVLQLEPFHSLYPKFVLERVKKILDPPKTVTFEFENNILYARGSALHPWIVKARELVETLPEIAEYRDDKLVDIDDRIKVLEQRLKFPDTVHLELKGGVLRVEGYAPKQWIAEARELAKTLPGVVAYQDENVIDIDREVEIAKQKIEDRVVYFTLPGITIASGQEDILNDLADTLKKFRQLTQILGKSVNIVIVGHTDSIGEEEENMNISRRRAEKILSFFASKGLETEMFETVGVSSKEPLKKELTERDRELNECVTFKVVEE